MKITLRITHPSPYDDSRRAVLPRPPQAHPHLVELLLLQLEHCQPVYLPLLPAQVLQCLDLGRDPGAGRAGLLILYIGLAGLAFRQFDQRGPAAAPAGGGPATTASLGGAGQSRGQGRGTAGDLVEQDRHLGVGGVEGGAGLLLPQLRQPLALLLQLQHPLQAELEALHGTVSRLAAPTGGHCANRRRLNVKTATPRRSAPSSPASGRSRCRSSISCFKNDRIAGRNSTALSTGGLVPLA